MQWIGEVIKASNAGGEFPFIDFVENLSFLAVWCQILQINWFSDLILIFKLIFLFFLKHI